jgi:hypothetical protein
MEKPKIEYVKDTFEEYLSKSDYIAASDTKNFMHSPRLYYYERYEKVREAVTEERHFPVGSAIHEAILEPHLFKSNYIVCPKYDRRTKQGKEDYAEFLLKTEGKTLLFEDEMEMVTKMAETAVKNKTLMELLQDSYREVSCYTTDPITGLKIRLRPDSLAKSKSTITDIKSCLDSSPRKFKHDVYSYDYSITNAYYCDFLGRENYVFAALEKTQPHQLTLMQLNDEMVDYGRKQYRTALDLLKWSIDNNYWCDYTEFEILKECYELGTLEEFFDTLERSERIILLK